MAPHWNERRTMSPARFDELLAYLDLTPKILARNEDYPERLVRRWLSGVMPIPPEVGAWLERVVQAATVSPLPVDDDGWLDAIIAGVGDSPEPTSEWFRRPAKAA